MYVNVDLHLDSLKVKNTIKLSAVYKMVTLYFLLLTHQPSPTKVGWPEKK